MTGETKWEEVDGVESDAIYCEDSKSILLEKAQIAVVSGEMTVNGWVEVVDQSNATVYVHLSSGNVSLKRPSGWVLAAAEMYNNEKVIYIHVLFIIRYLDICRNCRDKTQSFLNFPFPNFLIYT